MATRRGQECETQAGDESCSTSLVLLYSPIYDSQPYHRLQHVQYLSKKSSILPLPDGNQSN